MNRNHRKHNRLDLEREGRRKTKQQSRRKQRREKAEGQKFFAVPLAPLEG